MKRFCSMPHEVDWERVPRRSVRIENSRVLWGPLAVKSNVVSMPGSLNVITRRLGVMENSPRMPAAIALTNFAAKVEDAFTIAERARSTQVKEAVVQHEIQIAVEELRTELSHLLSSRKETA
jgi:hypothetical protein